MITAQSTSEELVERARKRMADPGFVWGIPYGFPGVDRKTGGIHRGQLTVLMARPSVGKSAWAGDVAKSGGKYILRERESGKNRKFWSDKVIRIVSQEMTAAEWQQRMICAEAQIPGEAVRTGFLSQVQFDNYQRAAEEVGKLPIEYLDDASSLRQITEFIKQDKRTAFWIADHLDILPGAVAGSQNANSSLSATIEVLRGLARDHAPGLLLTQMSRACEMRADKRPMMSDIYGSGMIEAAAQVIIGLYREDMYEQVPDDQRTQPLPAEVLILKNRNGETGRLHFFFAHSLPKWVDTTTYIESATR